ncbi:MAG: alkaline phosphatase [Chitinophagaceae bacterium]|nr:alkaline phosphatase [Chitinophagaceae bacterium]
MKTVFYWMSLWLLLYATPSQALTFVVDNLLNADPGGVYVVGDGTNTLRKCIRLANANAGLDNINFNIATGPFIILSASTLTVTDPVNINGYSQPGAAAGSLLIQLVASANGIQLLSLNAGSDGSTIRGLVMYTNNTGTVAIQANSSNNHVISGNYIGTDITGASRGGTTSLQNGIDLNGATGCTIGGTSGAITRNIVSCCSSIAVRIRSTSTNTTVQGNYIGTTVTGNAIPAVANGNNAIDINSSNNQLIGGSVYAARNVIGGSTIGINVQTCATLTIKGNMIGIGANGTTALANTAQGIRVQSTCSAVTIGGGLRPERNVISSNGNDGINMSGTITGLTIQNNYIGFDSLGVLARGNNGDGIDVSNASTILVGGSTYNLRNVIGNNTAVGLKLTTSTVSTVIKGNFIGLGADGSTSAGNTSQGMNISTAVAVVVGGPLTAERNVVGANGNDGIQVNPATGLTIQNNYIGFDSTGILSRPNAGDGMELDNSSSVLIGGTAYNLRNVIGNNTQDGIRMSNSTVSVTIKANFIGLTAKGAAAGNGSVGIQVSTATAVTIGGPTVYERNVIGSNNGDGMTLNIITGLTIQNNYIGFDTLGLAARGNAGDGIEVSGSSSSTVLIGGSTYNLRNVIGNNTQDGLRLNNILVSLIVKGNFIGLSLNGTAAPNANNGVDVNTAVNVSIGGLLVQERNIVSSNTQRGITINTASPVTIQNNYVGTDSTGMINRGNGQRGISVSQCASNLVIGGTVFAARNISSSNGQIGVAYDNSPGALLKGNFIGVAKDGITAMGNGQQGVLVSNCNSTIIGGSTLAERNIVSSNTGRGIEITNSNSITVVNNYIGVDSTGMAARGNNNNGLTVSNCLDPVIGGIAQGNLISNNMGHGISIQGTSSRAIVKGNIIGFAVNGNTAMGNTAGHGLEINASINAVVGGTAVAERNLIGNNFNHGIRVNASSGVTIQGNYIGVDVTGLLARGNGMTNSNNGIDADQSANLVIGGTTYSARNIVSGNGGDGIYLHNGCAGSLIKANFAGLGRDGSTLISNTNSGIRVWGDATSNGITFGGSTHAERNVCSGNGLTSAGLSRDGIRIEGNASNHTIKGNYCGTDSTGTIAIGNMWAGISVNEVSNGIIGGTGTYEGNISAGNHHEGIYMRNTVNCVVVNNRVGTDNTGTINLGNGEFGINMVQVSTNNTIGGSLAEANYIANTGADATQYSGSGIFVDSVSQYNKIVRNKIYCNAGLGIYVKTTGNEGIAPPVITAADPNTVSGTGSINGDSIHVYHTNVSGGACDCEGETFIGATVVSGGTWSITHNLNYTLPTAYNVTATETTANKSTSQFSPCNSALPVEFVAFTLSKTGQRSVDLVWSTAWEENNSHFVVERSSDGKQFEALSSVNGKGSFQGLSQYAAIDDEPLMGINYYRIRQVDVDGHSTTTAIKAIEWDGDGLQIIITTSNVGILSPENTTASYGVYTELGQQLLSGQVQLATNVYKPLSLGLPEGIYLFYVTTPTKSIWKKIPIR